MKKKEAIAKARQISLNTLWESAIGFACGQADFPKLVVLAFTTGTSIVAIVEEIIPEAHQTQDTNWSTLTFIGSFALSILFSSYLE